MQDKRADQIRPDLAPRTLAEMLAIPINDLPGLDVARMNLLCAAGIPGAETLDVEATLKLLDAWAAMVGRVTRIDFPKFQRDPAAFDGNEGLWRVVTLTRVLSKQFGVHYNPRLIDGRGWDWKDANDTMLCGPLGSRRSGSCASLPVLVAAVARRLGYPVFLAHAPQHVLARWDGRGHNQGKGHENPAWRTVFNIEYNGDGMSDHPDDYYRTWPVRWTPGLIEAEKQRKPPLYLRPLTPPEELASFLVERSHVLLENGRHDEAFEAVGHAVRLAPHNENHAACGVDVHHRKLVAVLRPWGLTPFAYCQMVRRRHAGYPLAFPWETVKMCPYRPGVPADVPRPFSPTPLHDPLRLAAEATVGPGPRPMPPELSLGLPDWMPRHATA